MTVHQIKTDMAAGGKECSLVHIFRYLKKFKIRPLGARQRPQQYPGDAAQKILNYLGFSGGAGSNAARGPFPVSTANLGRSAGKLISVRQLRAAKPQRKGK